MEKSLKNKKQDFFIQIRFFDLFKFLPLNSKLLTHLYFSLKKEKTFK